MNTGIYCIRNLMDGKEYIGSAARGFRRRWDRHLRDLRQGKHHSHLLQKAWNACGEAAFEFSILEECPPDQCLEREQHFIDTLDPHYNICRIAGSWLGRGVSPETRAKMGAWQKGRKLSPETCARIGAASKGRHPSPATRAKISASLMGHGASPEARARMSAALQGHSTSPSTRAKIGAANKGHHIITPDNKDRYGRTG